mmetsp:Transcript_76144/g.204378  ORF Transcript_76144/g.204378 Transcript_76144/m.204378 type:complete len:384 (-) Transcript_76144:736-1887(-)
MTASTKNATNIPSRLRKTASSMLAPAFLAARTRQAALTISPYVLKGTSQTQQQRASTTTSAHECTVGRKCQASFETVLVIKWSSNAAYSMPSLSSSSWSSILVCATNLPKLLLKLDCTVFLSSDLRFPATPLGTRSLRSLAGHGLVACRPSLDPPANFTSCRPLQKRPLPPDGSPSLVPERPSWPPGPDSDLDSDSDLSDPGKDPRSGDNLGRRRTIGLCSVPRQEPPSRSIRASNLLLDASEPSPSSSTRASFSSSAGSFSSSFAISSLSWRSAGSYCALSAGLSCVLLFTTSPLGSCFCSFSSRSADAGLSSASCPSEERGAGSCLTDAESEPSPSVSAVRRSLCTLEFLESCRLNESSTATSPITSLFPSDIPRFGCEPI